jgi:hypothetical protein
MVETKLIEARKAYQFAISAFGKEINVDLGKTVETMQDIVYYNALAPPTFSGPPPTAS